MSFIRKAVLYTALVLCANAALADPALEALRDGSMKKLLFHSAAKPTSNAAFLDEAEGEMTLADLKGGYVLVNFWATWCAPCRQEMPGLNTLQKEFGGKDFRVVTIATGRNQPAAIRRFFEEIGVDALPKYRDPKSALARDMGVLGLPITVLLNPEGLEIARLRGDADWDSDSARAIVAAITGGS
ncbi:MAG: TlpA family protein disulfide reductase [Rhodobacter sp.]|jgi:thiol-disulfide isomerase/thioredoxin|nr:TlpA family protein disulfide reductase [Rhodobacter sp.]